MTWGVLCPHASHALSVQRHHRAADVHCNHPGGIVFAPDAFMHY
eukprot:CAMPEP_0204274802 /NCGR_PEP_ID=MMETSP0468-20130131/25393_1 /ASSEMBLY_ACC=CAM_ASM_000383 /TAXON_ID=2969 /ORGANISM="Oxyrrhis marina" /LENGTH=43 /DNA_ID= /DNA_START= /DNA_END= /DNA_ORIENTATION=